jgi:hypothetical protein
LRACRRNALSLQPQRFEELIDNPIGSLIPKTALVPDRSQMLIDTKYNEHEFGSDSRHDNAHGGAEHAGDEKDDADKWIIRHGRQRTDRAGEAEQNRNDDCQPIKDLNHSGRDKPFPLEKITKAEHEATSSRAPNRRQTALRDRSGQSQLIATVKALAPSRRKDRAHPSIAFVDGQRWDI